VYSQQWHCCDLYTLFFYSLSTLSFFLSNCCMYCTHCKEHLPLVAYHRHFKNVDNMTKRILCTISVLVSIINNMSTKDTHYSKCQHVHCIITVSESYRLYHHYNETLYCHHYGVICGNNNKLYVSTIF